MSYSFDGTDDILTVSPGDLDNEQVTFFATAYPTTYGENGRGQFFNHGAGGELNCRYAFYLDDNTSGSVQSLHFLADRVSSPGRWRANSTVVLNQWQSVAATYDNASTANVPILYRNGAVVASTAAQAPSGAVAMNEPQPFYMGNNQGLGRTFSGLIGVLAMWNRILSPSEIMLVHLGGVRKVLRGVQLWYRGTNGGGTPDWTGKGRTVTVTGALVSSDASGDRLAAG